MQTIKCIGVTTIKVAFMALAYCFAGVLGVAVMADQLDDDK